MVAKLAAPLAINNKVYTNLQDAMPDLLAPSGKIVQLDGATSFVGAGKLIGAGGPGIPKSLWVKTAGTMTGIDAYGNVITAFPLYQGMNPVMVSEITSLSTAAGIFGLY